MAADDLTKPLGLARPGKLAGWRLAGALAGVLAVAVGTVGGTVWLYREPGPTVTAVINTPAPGAVTLADRTGSTTRPDDFDGPGLVDVKPDGGLSDIGKVIIHDPSNPAPMQLAVLPDDTLIEMSDYGPLPRIAGNGKRPLDAYARPTDSDRRDTRIAIVVGGVGIDPDGTALAISLPGTVTLAMAPYPSNLDEWLADARTAGHEILLQIPLEPYSYPKTDPGPHTLTTDAPADENIDRLHWLLARTTNYVGVVNYMGARFTSDATALPPILDEIGRRGLLYLDDGSSARSRAGEIASGRTPFLKADLVLDADLSAEAIDGRLRELQTIARQRGYAIATATAFPLTVERIAAFAKVAADRNITLVPISALTGSGAR